MSSMEVIKLNCTEPPFIRSAPTCLSVYRTKHRIHLTKHRIQFKQLCRLSVLDTPKQYREWRDYGWSSLGSPLTLSTNRANNGAFLVYVERIYASLQILFTITRLSNLKKQHDYFRRKGHLLRVIAKSPGEWMRPECYGDAGNLYIFCL